MNIETIFDNVIKNDHMILLNNIKSLNIENNELLIKRMLGKIYFDYENFMNSLDVFNQLFNKFHYDEDLHNILLCFRKLINDSDKFNVNFIYQLMNSIIQQQKIIPIKLLSFILYNISKLNPEKIYEFLTIIHNKDNDESTKYYIYSILIFLTNTFNKFHLINPFLETYFSSTNDLYLIDYIDKNKNISLNINILNLILNKLIRPHILFTNTNEIQNDFVRILINLKQLNKILYNVHFFNSQQQLINFIAVSPAYEFCYYGFNCKEIYIEFIKLFHNLYPSFITNIENHKKTNKIKLGVISSFIVQDHSVGNDRIGIVKSLINNDKFDVKIISNKEQSILFNNIIGNSNNLLYIDTPIDDLINKIIEFDFDIILYPDIGMSLEYQILACNRLAPIQITTWGHSETSGIDTIDYFISSSLYETNDAQKFYTEKLIPLDSLCTFYYNRLKLYNITLHNKLYYKFGFSKCNHLYGMLYEEQKYHPAFMNLLQQILNKDDKAIFVFISNQSKKQDFITYLELFFNDKMEHIRILDRMKFDNYMECLNCMDIILDTYPFGGCNSSIDAFYVDKIVMTLPFDKLNGRFTQGFYKKMNIFDPICNSFNDFIDKTIYYISNINERNLLEEKIKNNKYLLFEEQKSIDDWTNCLFDLYKQLV